MTTSTFRSGSYVFTMGREYIDITSSHPTPNEHWAFTDANGHEHLYDHGYPTLEMVVDAEHWCNGDEGWARHDPHMHVDEAHYECRQCREVIKPAMDPGGTRKSVPGSVTATLEGPRSDGYVVVAHLMDAEVERYSAATTDETALAILDAVPNERLSSLTFTTG